MTVMKGFLEEKAFELRLHHRKLLQVEPRKEQLMPGEL